MNFIISAKFFGIHFDATSEIPMPGFPDWQGGSQESFLDGGLIRLLPESEMVPRPEVSVDVPVGTRLAVVDSEVYTFRNERVGPHHLSREKREVPRGSVSPHFSWRDEVGLVWHTSFQKLEDAERAFREWLREDGFEINDGKFHHGEGKYFSCPPPPKGFYYLEVWASCDGYGVAIAVPNQWSLLFRQHLRHYLVLRGKELKEYSPQILVPRGTLVFVGGKWKDLLDSFLEGDVDETLFAVATVVVDNPKLRDMGQ